MSTPETKTPLWAQPIEVLGLTGEYASGKTLYSLTIAPGKDTLAYDLEKSNATYLTLGFDRVDVPTEMLRSHPNGYKPVDTYLWWLSHVRSVPAGKYRVIVIDPVSEIESGLVDWVRSHPAHFGKTTAEYVKMAGLMWGDVKELWKSILADIASRCETFVFTSHMTNIWQKDGPTGKRKAKGKETLMELASLYLQMERKKDAKGVTPAKPAAVVLKSRLSTIRFDPATGDTTIIPTLPPRLPVATPLAVRQYMAAPPDYSALTEGERAPDAVATEEEKAQLRYETARTENETEQLKMARLDREQAAAEKRQERAKTAATPAVAPAKTDAAVNGNAAQRANGPNRLSPDPNAPTSPGKLTVGQRAKLDQFAARLLRHSCGGDRELLKDKWRKLLTKRGAERTAELTPQQADDLISALHQHLDGADPLFQPGVHGNPPEGPTPPPVPTAPAVESNHAPPALTT